MIRFCTKCGAPLNEKGVCPKCPSTPSKAYAFRTLINNIKKRMGIGWDGEDATNPFERGLRIVPDVVVADEAEQPIKQYNIAHLRSRIMQKYAEGRLLVTNKRLIFRAAGMSVSGRITVQHEFNLSEIGGVEIKKSNRVSFLSILLALCVSFLIVVPVEEWVGTLVKAVPGLAMVCGYLIAALLIISFFVSKRKFWLKLIGTSAAVGIMSGLTDFSIVGVFLGESILNVHNAVFFAFALLWIFNMILVAFVPDLTLCIKTKSAGEAVQIRRKVLGFGIKPANEYSDFSEVLPWDDTEKAAQELGALIADVQTMGDMAIEKWKV